MGKWILGIIPGPARVTVSLYIPNVCFVLKRKARNEPETYKLTVRHVIRWRICNLEGIVIHFYQPTRCSLCAFYALTLMKGTTVFCQFSARKSLHDSAVWAVDTLQLFKGASVFCQSLSKIRLVLLVDSSRFIFPTYWLLVSWRSCINYTLYVMPYDM
jgi:hypothetical protein